MTTRPTRLLRLAVLAALAALLPAPESGAQTIIRRGPGGDSSIVRVERIDATKAVLLPELGAVIKADGKDLVVSRVAPAEGRKEDYRSVDLQEGDHVLLLNGKRVREIKPLRESYDALPTGGEVKLGLQRGEQLLTVTFPKADPKDMGGVRIVRKGAPDGSRIVPELGVFVADSPDGPKVKELMPPDVRPGGKVALAEGDVITALNGKTVRTADQLVSLLERVKTGAEIALEVRRGGTGQTLRFPKAEAPGQIIIRRQ